LWHERFIRHNGIKNDVKMSVVFNDDEIFEAFYDEGNAMDFDEQPNHIQMMSLHNIDVISDPVVWFKNLMDIRLSWYINGLKL
jgi:hypothetical protein